VLIIHTLFESTQPTKKPMRNSRHRVLALMILVLHFPFSATAKQAELGTQENPYPVPKTEKPVKLDGVLDDEAWVKATVVELNYEVSPRINVVPPVKTEVLFTYDQSCFYIGFRCYDPEPSKIRAHLSERDKFSNSDWVAVEIDTYNDSRRAFTLFSTSTGVQMDGLSDAAGIKDYNWDMIYDTAAKINDWGYGVEMAIPFSSLRFQRTRGKQVWGINTVRGYPRTVAHQIWARPYDRSNTCRVCQYMRIEGFESVSPGRNIEINPTLSGTTTQAREGFPEGGFTNRDRDEEAGLTARWGITPNLAFSGTANPDFSQVEADSAQLDINQPFALFFPERRPFFTEGMDFFKSYLSVIYTRTLRDPRWGIKLSGKEGANAIGAYIVRDEITNLIFPGSQFSRSTSIAERNMSSVFRYGRDIWNNSTIGVLFTSREGGGYFNRVYGVDGNLRFTQKDEMSFQVLGSSTRYKESTASEFGQTVGAFSDLALSATYTHKTQNHQVQVDYLDLGEEFRADLGFLPQVGIRRLQASSDYNWFAKKRGSWWSKLSLNNAGQYMTERDGTVLIRSLTNSFTYSGILQTSLTLGNTTSRQRYNQVDFALMQFNVSAGVIPTGYLSFSVSSSIGDGIDYVNTRKGKKISLTPYLVYDIGQHLRLTAFHTFEKMNVESRRLYTANISQAAVIYHFTAKMFVRAIVQYYDYDYNISNYLIPRESEFRQFFTQLLFSYKINPRTVLFLGYSDNYFGGPESGLKKKDYTFFAKVGYAWVI